MTPGDAAAFSIDHHAALMHGHDHEGLSERTRHTHGESTEDLDEKKSQKIGKMITPYLAQHIPNQYNPQGADRDGQDAQGSTADTKYCYRHRPDLLCRRQADEPSMKELQDVCDMARVT
jgi:F-box/WD-40 domain protein MET30